MCEKNQAAEAAYKQKAMEHDISDMPEVDVEKAYHAVEDGVVGVYQKIETGVVAGFAKMTDQIVEKFLTREGETVEEAKERMNRDIRK